MNSSSGNSMAKIITDDGNEYKIRATVAAFAVAMEEVLFENEHKGGWDNDSLMDLWIKLYDEQGELNRAICNGDKNEILHESIDVANYAMMIYINSSSEVNE